ncbi:MAG: type IV secretory system conjugative DNA transfer family protein [Lachnospiraceae bacterium]|nr:type IV secretory system conjugative DNA transfer family protein [Lachnospiraceae bacterium]
MKIRNTRQKSAGSESVQGRVGRESNLLLSQNIKISYNTWLSKLGSLNCLVIGGTGEGKSRGFVKPNIYSLPVDPRDGKPISFVLTDPKGELCQDTAGFLEANGYQIRVFNINEQRFSDCYNPFRYIQSADSLLIMVDSVVENANGGKIPSDPHWMNSAKSLLNSICYAVYYEFAFRDQNFTTVSELLNMCGFSEGDENYQSGYDVWLDHLMKTSRMGEEHPAIVWRRKVSATGKEMSSIISTAQTAVRLFASKDIQRLTNVDTLEMDTIGDRPTAFYIIIPTTNSTYNFLISLLYTQLFESLYYRAQNVFNGNLPHHVTFFQDEFANVGKIPDFDKKIATFRSVNLSTCMIVQSPNQIETLYDKAAADIMDNVHQIVFIGSGGQGEKSATKWMSNALGIKTIQAEQTSVHASKTVGMFGLDGSTVEHSYNATQRPLMTQDELYRLPSNQCIVMVKGQKPFLDEKIDPDRCLNFSSDHFSVQGEHGRKLKKELLYPINDKDPRYPAKKRTFDSYRLGIAQSVKIDEEQNEQRKRDMKEDEKYDPVPQEPVMPEIKPLTDVIASGEGKVKKFEPAGFYNEGEEENKDSGGISQQGAKENNSYWIER